MTNKNIPDSAADKKTDSAENKANAPKPEMGSARAANQHGNSSSHPEANDERRELTRTSDATVPNPGRDITTGSDGFDGQGRERMSDEDRDLTNADRLDKGTNSKNSEQATSDDRRNSESKGTKA